MAVVLFSLTACMVTKWRVHKTWTKLTNRLGQLWNILHWRSFKKAQDTISKK